MCHQNSIDLVALKFGSYRIGMLISEVERIAGENGSVIELYVYNDALIRVIPDEISIVLSPMKEVIQIGSFSPKYRFQNIGVGSDLSAVEMTLGRLSLDDDEGLIYSPIEFPHLLIETDEDDRREIVCWIGVW